MSLANFHDLKYPPKKLFLQKCCFQLVMHEDNNRLELRTGAFGVKHSTNLTAGWGTALSLTGVRKQLLPIVVPLVVTDANIDMHRFI